MKTFQGGKPGKRSRDKQRFDLLWPKSPGTPILQLTELEFAMIWIVLTIQFWVTDLWFTTHKSNQKKERKKCAPDTFGLEKCRFFL